MKFISMMFGVVYPSIESYKALKTETKDDDVQVRHGVAVDIRETFKWLQIQQTLIQIQQTLRERDGETANNV